MINNPRVIIADEPTAHLDTNLSNEFMEIIQGLNSEGKTIILASHDPLVHQAGAVSAIVRMRDGKIEETA